MQGTLTHTALDASSILINSLAITYQADKKSATLGFNFTWASKTNLPPIPVGEVVRLTAITFFRVIKNAMEFVMCRYR